jgi:hypothetical protein
MQRKVNGKKWWRIVLSGWRAWVVPIVAALWVVVLAAWITVQREHNRRDSIIAEGLEATATITELTKQRVNVHKYAWDDIDPSWMEYTVHYAWRTRGLRDAQAACEVRGGLWMQWRVGQELPILYLPGRPDDSLPTVVAAEHEGAWPWPQAVAATIPFGIAFWLIGRSARRYGRYLAESPMAWADLVSQQKDPYIDEVDVVLRYRAGPRDVATCRKKMRASALAATMIDGRVPVLYNRDHPARCTLLDPSRRGLLKWSEPPHPPPAPEPPANT